jgi:hypothetical protein
MQTETLSQPTLAVAAYKTAGRDLGSGRTDEIRQALEEDKWKDANTRQRTAGHHSFLQLANLARATHWNGNKERSIKKPKQEQSGKVRQTDRQLTS